MVEEQQHLRGFTGRKPQSKAPPQFAENTQLEEVADRQCPLLSFGQMYNAADWTCVATIPAGHVGSSGRGVEAVLVEGSFLFVGTEIQCPLIPKVTVGIVRAWNLDVPSVNTSRRFF